MDIGTILSSAWNKFSKNMGMCIVIYLVGAILGGMLSLIVIGIPILAGTWKAMRKAQRGETPEFGDLFTEMSNIGKWVMLWLVFIIMGIVACIPVLGQIAMIVVMFGMAFVIPLMLERDLSAFDAIKVSLNTIKGNLGGLILPILVLSIIGGLFAPITGPLMVIGMWELYDQTTFAS